MRNYSSILQKVTITKEYKRIINPLSWELMDLIENNILSKDEADELFMMIIDGIVDWEFDSVIKGVAILNDLKIINGIIQGEHYA